MSVLILFIMVGLFSPLSLVSVSAWSHPRAVSPHIMHHYSSWRPKHLTQTQLSSTSSPTSSELSSAYDRNLPTALVGEAVRSALRSDRGICFDFSSDRYVDEASGTDSRLVSVVKLHGKGTKPFINAKFSQSIPNNNFGGGVLQLSPKTELIRKGHAFESAYLTSKGRIIDRLLVLAFPSQSNEEIMDDAFLITSPGNNGPTLYNELSPLVFPMDKVTLTDFSSQTSVLTLACSSLKDARTSFNKNVLKLLMKDDSYSREFEFPKEGVCHHYRVSSTETSTDVYILQHTYLSPEICHGYTLIFQKSADSNKPTLADQIWSNLTDEQNNEGPVGVGPLEYDTLRVEAGLPGYGYEMTGDGPKKNKSPSSSAEKDDQDEKGDDKYYAKANPLELHLQNIISTEKGCYQGQEGIASMLKNKRGCPRQLYQAVFYDSENDFNGDGGNIGLVSIDNKKLMDFQKLKKQADPILNDTRQPRPGDDIYVLGSGDSISVGKITSVAEPNGTGDAKTVAMALVRRPGSILKAIKEQDLELPRWWEDDDPDSEDDEDANRNIAKGMGTEKGGSGMMRPPPLDPLHNLEVVVGGTYTMGRLFSVPSRRFGGKPSGDGAVATLLDYEQRGEVVDTGKDGPPAYFGEIEVTDAEVTANLPTVETDSQLFLDDEEGGGDDDQITDDLLEKAEEEAAKAAAAAEAAAAEAKRKEEKMKALKAKAEAAMEARRKKKASS